MNLKYSRCIKLAEQYFNAKDVSSCIMKYHQALEHKPNDVVSLLRLTQLYLSKGKFKLPSEYVTQASKEYIDNPLAALELIRLLELLGKTHIIVDILKLLPPKKWDSATTLAELCLVLNFTSAIDQAHEYALEAIQREPENPNALYQYAVAEHYYGNFDVATKAIESCLEKLPNFAAPHWLLSSFKLPGNETRITRIQKVLETCTDQDSKTKLNYALHNEFHQLGQINESWDALEKANQLKRKRVHYSKENTTALFDKLKTWSLNEIDTGDGYVDPELTPIFIVGLHRSGTTLTERLIGGHSSVSIAGETFGITNQLRNEIDSYFSGTTSIEAIDRRNELDYHAIGKNYTESMSWLSKGNQFITDKEPLNYLNIGFILRALPSAKIIFVRRNPIAVGFSSLRTSFHNGCEYAYDQMDFADYYTQYISLIEFWKSTLQERVLEINYEDLIDHPQENIDKMLHYCGLNYESGLSEIQNRKEVSTTASSVMMREGIKKDRDLIWKKYASKLEPMINYFEDASDNA